MVESSVALPTHDPQKHAPGDKEEADIELLLVASSDEENSSDDNQSI